MIKNAIIIATIPLIVIMSFVFSKLEATQPIRAISVAMTIANIAFNHPISSFILSLSPLYLSYSI